MKKKSKNKIPTGNFTLLSQLPKDEKLYKDCIEFLSLIDPKRWPKERVLYATETLHYEILVFYRLKKIIGTASFNPDRKDNTAKLFSIFIAPEYRKRGLTKILLTRFLKRVRQNGFKKAQIGERGSSAVTGILNSLKRDQKELGILFAEIDPATGEVAINK